MRTTIENQKQENTISVNTIQTNNNSAKPEILKQLFRAFVINNRTHNGRREGNIYLN